MLSRGLSASLRVASSRVPLRCRAGVRTMVSGVGCDPIFDGSSAGGAARCRPHGRRPTAAALAAAARCRPAVTSSCRRRRPSSPMIGVRGGGPELPRASILVCGRHFGEARPVPRGTPGGRRQDGAPSWPATTHARHAAALTPPPCPAAPQAEQNKLVMAGALAEPVDGALFIFRCAGAGRRRGRRAWVSIALPLPAPACPCSCPTPRNVTKADIEAFVAADPYVQAGLVPKHEIRPYMVVAGDCQ